MFLLDIVQVSALGCKSFAVLFDDIECDMCAADAKEFPSFAHAQVTITNDLFAHLEHPDVFLFCPTEYCGSRATPSITESQYLKHIGSDLHPNIDIMWTGEGCVCVCKGGAPGTFQTNTVFIVMYSRQ